jgi:16S rRNA (guanine527-N7)-methyltransferase
MGTAMLLRLTKEEFSAALLRASPPPLPASAIDALHAHYLELARWAPTIDLIGPGAHAELFERHYAESLAALPWLPAQPFRLVDLGSGAGFPGLVLAAARPDAEVWLVEPRERRAAFLVSAVRKAGLGARVVAARVGAGSAPDLPERIAVVTLRALRLDPPMVRALTPRLAAGASLLVWSGAAPPELPAWFEPARSLRLPASRDRHLREFRWHGAAP